MTLRDQIDKNYLKDMFLNECYIASKVSTLKVYVEF